MTTSAIFLTSYVILWIAVCVLFILVAALAREMSGTTVSNLEVRAARNGPPIGAKLKLSTEAIGRVLQSRVLLLFLSSTCKACSGYRSTVLAFAPGAADAAIVVVCDGPASDVARFLLPLGDVVDAVPDPAGEISRELGVRMRPFGLALEAGRVRSKTARLTTEDLRRMYVAVTGSEPVGVEGRLT